MITPEMAMAATMAAWDNMMIGFFVVGVILLIAEPIVRWIRK